jgi:hypothetical protein
MFSKYTELELETAKYEANGALRGYGNPMSKAKTNLLRCQINSIKFKDDTNIKHLPPNKSYKMLGVNNKPFRDHLKQSKPKPSQDVRDHLKHVTTDVRQLAKVLSKKKLSPRGEKTSDRSIDQFQVP